MTWPAAAPARRRLSPLALAALLCVASAAPAPAQVTISGGVSWSGGYPIGGAAAELRSNAGGTTPPPYTWFTVDSEVSSATGAEVRVGFDVHRRLTIEGAAMFARPHIGFTIGRDAEAGAQTLAGESLQQYVFEGAVVWHWPIGAAPRLVPFVSGGAGYLRQLHEERTLVESGQLYYAGAGARYWLRGRPDSSTSVGVRGDIRMNLRVNGIDFANQTRFYPALSLQLFVGL